MKYSIQKNVISIARDLFFKESGYLNREIHYYWKVRKMC